MVEWNGIFRLFRFSGILGQTGEVHPKFRKEIPENVCSIRSTTRNFRNFWSNGKRPRILVCSVNFLLDHILILPRGTAQVFNCRQPILNLVHQGQISVNKQRKPVSTLEQVLRIYVVVVPIWFSSCVIYLDLE